MFQVQRSEQNTKVDMKSGLYPATFLKFDAVEAHDFEWAMPNGKFKFIYKDENDRIHDIMINYPDMLSAIDITDFKELRKTWSYKFSELIFNHLESIFGVTQDQFNAFQSTITEEDMVSPTVLAEKLNLFVEEVAVTNEPKAGHIVVHDNGKGRIVPFTWDFTRYAEGKATHADASGNLFTVAKNGWVNGALPIGEVTIEYIEGSTPIPTGENEVMEITPVEALVQVFAPMTQVTIGGTSKWKRVFNPFFVGDAEFKVVDSVNWKNEPIRAGFLTRKEGDREYFYLLNGFGETVNTDAEITE